MPEKNIIKITDCREGFIIGGSHRCHAPYIVSDEAGIFRVLDDVVKYFFPEPFNFDYTNAKLSEQTVAGFEASREIYNLCVSHYINVTKLHKKQLEKLVTGLNELLSSKPQVH